MPTINDFMCKRLIVAFILFWGLSSGTQGLVIKGDGAWDRWRPAAVQKQMDVSHAIWATILSNYLQKAPSSAINLFAYDRVSPADKKLLDQYISQMELINVANLTREQQMAYWINLYNALTVKVVLGSWPVKSIKEIKSGIFDSGPWNLELAQVDGIDLTLNQIEHRILRPLYQDSRVHFAVNCASIGCPDLASRPYIDVELDNMLTEAAQSYIDHPRGINIIDNKLILSSIFKWYQDDFGRNRKELLLYLAGFAKPDLAQRLGDWQGHIKYAYDWQINSVAASDK